MNDTPAPTDLKLDARQARRRWAAVIILVGLAFLLVAGLIIRTSVGFGPYEESARAARPPTLWEWLGLLIVPLAVAAGAALISYVQKRTELDIAQKARASEQQIASDRLRQASLEGYYDRMTDLLLTHKLREAEAEARSLARARTIAVAQGLDGERKGQLLAFLYTSGLIAKHSGVIDLEGVDFSGASMYLADLRGANLRGAVLNGANLSRADLSEANLSRADLSKANVSLANLSEANLSEANLSEANLSKARLSKANLSLAKVCGARLCRAKLSRANLNWARLNRANLSRADLSKANVSLANLSEADLSEANLSETDLSGATLSGAYLLVANLSLANLRDVRGWTIEQLEQAREVAGSIMPDGTQLTLPAIRFSEAIEGPTFAEWKAQYLAGQETGANET